VLTMNLNDLTQSPSTTSASSSTPPPSKRHRRPQRW
jgi:hypothetical protein